MSTAPTAQTKISKREAEQVERANASDRQPVVFLHGLWLLASSWDRWGMSLITELAKKPAVVGHSFGELLTQIIAGRGHSLASVAKQLYESYSVPAPGRPLFQAATANLNPRTEAKVDTKYPQRGPLLVIAGDRDHTVPWTIASASYKRQNHNQGVTEIIKLPIRGHALTIDSGWREVADTALAFVTRFL